MKTIGVQKNSRVRTLGVTETVTVTNAIVLFLLDESGSMESDDRIKSLNDAINRFPQDVCANNGFARTNIEVAVMAFDSSVRLVSDWTPVGNYSPVLLSANGGTNLGLALDKAIEKVNEKLANSPCDIAHIVLISDGDGGDVTNAASEIKRLKSEGKLAFWMLGVPGYNKDTALKLTGGERLYELKKGKQFDYTDFIRVLVSAVVNYQNTDTNANLRPIPEMKKVGTNSNGSQGSTGGSIGGGFFGGGSSNGKL